MRHHVLAILAALSMGQRIGQYGWTPERIWGVIAVAIAIAYGAGALWAVAKGRQDFDDPLRPLQTKLAIGLCGLALFLALPILDFGAISAKSQLARLESGKVKAEEFDWTAMAFDFGPEGRERLGEIARGGAANLRTLAKAALDSKNRYSLSEETESAAQQARLARARAAKSRGRDWRPGGEHKDPRAKYKLTRDQKRARFKRRSRKP